MDYANPDALVSTDWLAQHLDSPDVRIVDATWFLPTMGRDAQAEYAACHIPGAVYFDIDAVCDETSPLPHMLPRPEKFSSMVRKLGLGDGERIVIYDNNGMIAGARAWWMFRVFGHDDVAVLNGGLGKWQAEGRPVTDEATLPRERHFTARTNRLLVRELEQVRANLDDKREVYVDARARGRFDGAEPEFRPGLASGHIPESVNLPYNRLLDRKDGTMLPADDISAQFAAIGLTPGRDAIATTCGSGVSACVLSLGLYLIGSKDVAVYDGSWTEWGGRDDTPKAP